MEQLGSPRESGKLVLITNRWAYIDEPIEVMLEKGEKPSGPYAKHDFVYFGHVLSHCHFAK